MATLLLMLALIELISGRDISELQGLGLGVEI